MNEPAHKKAEREAFERVAQIMSLPMPPQEPKISAEETFHPWDIFPSVYGLYDGEFDRMALQVLIELAEGNFTSRRRDLAAEMFREMLCAADLCDYGTSPRGCFPNQEFGKALPELIRMWREYAVIAWGVNVLAEEPTNA